MAGNETTRPPAPERQKRGLVVVDEAKNRADAQAFMRSQGLLQSGHHDDAETILRDLASTPTTTVQAHAAMVLGALLVARGTAAAALDAVDVLAGIPARGVAVDRGVVAMVRAQAYRKLGRYDDAVAAGQEAFAAAPTSERCLVLASAWLSSGRAAEAAAVLLDGVVRAPDDIALLGQYAGALILAGDHVAATAAVALLDARAATDDPEWHRQRAWVAACGRDPAAGQAALDRALALDGPGTRAWFHDDETMAMAGLVA